MTSKASCIMIKNISGLRHVVKVQKSKSYESLQLTTYLSTSFSFTMNNYCVDDKNRRTPSWPSSARVTPEAKISKIFHDQLKWSG